jgi:zinc protease
VADVDPRSKTERFYRTYAVPGYATGSQGEAQALSLLTNILARGYVSRLYRKLVIRDKIASSVWGNYSGYLVDGGELALLVLATDSDLSDVEAGVDEVLEEIRKDGVTQEELVCAKRSLVANYIYDGTDQFTLSFRHGQAAMVGLSVDDVEDWPAAISRVSADDIAKVATKYLVSRRSVTGWLTCGKGRPRALTSSGRRGSA